MTEDEVIDRLFADFRGDFCERLKFVKLCHKGDQDGDEDGLLWHFTRFKNLQKMLTRREIWLSDLAYSNDANEVVYGLSRVNSVVDEISKRWPNRKNAKIVLRMAKRVLQRSSEPFHNYAFSLSTEHDTVQHWSIYGDGLNICPVRDNPLIAIGFDAGALFYPLELSSDDPPIYMINTVSGNDAADDLANYWGIKAGLALNVLDSQRTSIRAKRVYKLLEHMLVLACSLVKNNGWKDEGEYRLLYITKDFGDEQIYLPERPDHRGRYAPLKWTEERSPVRAVVTHPLADTAFVEKSLRKLPGGRDIIFKKSELNPRPI